MADWSISSTFQVITWQDNRQGGHEKKHSLEESLPSEKNLGASINLSICIYYTKRMHLNVHTMFLFF